MGAFFRRLIALFRRNRLERDWDDELAFHLAMRQEEHARKGIEPAKAEVAAVVQRFGILHAKDQIRDAWSFVWFDMVVQDLRFAFRGLARAPGLTSATVLTLATGVGATTALLAVVDAVLIRPLPYPESERIVRISGSSLQAFIRFAGPQQFDLAFPELRQSPALESIGVYQTGGVNIGGEPAVRLRAAAVSASLFDVLGVPAAIGRTFAERDLTESRHLAVLSQRTWRTRFAANQSVLSQTVVINGRQFVILGVMPAQFDFPVGTDIWVPHGGDRQIGGDVQTPKLLARLRHGVGYPQARDAIGQVIRLRHRQATIILTSLRDVLVGNVRRTVVAVLAGALLLLLIACGNAAHLLLARVMARDREFAVRRALGASNAQLIRQVLTEGMLIACLASAVAVLAMTWSMDALRRLIPEAIHGADDIAVDVRVAAAATVALATPARRSRRRPQVGGHTRNRR